MTSAAAEPFGRQAPRAGGRFLPALDALRGVAILAVFVQHLGDRFLPLWRASLEHALPPSLAGWALTVVHHAWWGVDLFFVVSGFSLALGWLSAYERGGPPPRFVDFLRRRSARVLPAFGVALLVMLALRPEVLHLPEFPHAALAHAAMLQGYLAPGGIVLIGAAWSLTTEVHFYLLMPLLARPILGGRGPWRQLAVAAAVVLAAWITRGALHALVLEPGHHTALLEATQRRWIVSRLDQFVLGMLAAAAHRALLASVHRPAAARAAPWVVAAAAAALVICFRAEGALYLSEGGSWPYAPMSVATGVLVLAAAHLDGRALRVATPRALCALGVWSYGIFLYHQLALGVVSARFPFAVGEATWPRAGVTAVASLTLSVAAGWASFRWLEAPVMRWVERRGKKERAAAISAGGMQDMA